MALICAGGCLETANAGPNAGGTLIVSLYEGTFFTQELPPPCDDLLADCEAAVTNGPSYEESPFASVIHVLAAFPPPGGRLMGVVWGVDYDPEQTFILQYGSCGDFELANDDWPAPGSGTAITWFTVQTDPIVPMYWFAAYGYDGASLDLGLHPAHGGQFADDAIPSVVDDIAGFGSFGFGSNPGFNVCPVPGGPRGACCFDDGSCAITTEADCAAAGGVYKGDGSDCDSCEPVPTIERTWGGIKNQYR